eukprot:PhM_4_TR2723/c0_g1_i1/m.105112
MRSLLFFLDSLVFFFLFILNVFSRGVSLLFRDVVTDVAWVAAVHRQLRVQRQHTDRSLRLIELCAKCNPLVPEHTETAPCTCEFIFKPLQLGEVTARRRAVDVVLRERRCHGIHELLIFLCDLSRRQLRSLGRLGQNLQLVDPVLKHRLLLSILLPLLSQDHGEVPHLLALCVALMRHGDELLLGLLEQGLLLAETVTDLPQRKVGLVRAVLDTVDDVCVSWHRDSNATGEGRLLLFLLLVLCRALIYHHQRGPETRLCVGRSFHVSRCEFSLKVTDLRTVVFVQLRDPALVFLPQHVDGPFVACHEALLQLRHLPLQLLAHCLVVHVDVLLGLLLDRDGTLPEAHRSQRLGLVVLRRGHRHHDGRAALSAEGVAQQLRQFGVAEARDLPLCHLLHDDAELHERLVDELGLVELLALDLRLFLTLAASEVAQNKPAVHTLPAVPRLLRNVHRENGVAATASVIHRRLRGALARGPKVEVSHRFLDRRSGTTNLFAVTARQRNFVHLVHCEARVLSVVA